MFKTRSMVTLLLTLPLVTSSMAAGITRFASSSPDAPFSVATQVGNTVYLSGQLPLDKQGKMADNMTAQARQVMDNVKSAAAVAGLTMNDIFKCTVMIDDISQWGDFNKVYVTYFEKASYLRVALSALSVWRWELCWKWNVWATSTWNKRVARDGGVKKQRSPQRDSFFFYFKSKMYLSRKTSARI